MENFIVFLSCLIPLLSLFALGGSLADFLQQRAEKRRVLDWQRRLVRRV